ncbi:hypothetical protein LRP67_12485 [Nocardioides sp. cx-169]|uniref:hypothetical protein n=1 Tax=Nocardioides sp. cx-169 TaxID=2899080 RepID=UPI001E447D8B|nr:hypothetical protein [Nocardioides sp. cx-169]MCD4534904.1 hypothetical protein [Nocardioides sp. cx-169]
MSSLHDRLADLAEDGPDRPQPRDAWERGRRYGRRRRLQAAALSLVLLTAVGSLLGALLPALSYDVGPADAEAALRLPDRLYTPSPWLPGTDDVGEIGPLVALVGAERKTWSGSGAGVAGVSAEGDYAFLDLPGLGGALGRDQGASIALSDDGRLVAYPLTGRPEGEPTFVGVAVYDTVTGEVTSQRIPTEHGISFGGFAWAGARLWMQYGQLEQAADEEPSSSWGSEYHVYSWDLDDGIRRASGRLANRMPDVSASSGLVTWQGRRLWVFDREGASVLRDLRLDLASDAPPALNPSGTRVAVLEDPDGDPTLSDGRPYLLRAGVVPEGENVRVATARVGDRTADELWGWRDDWHVLVRDLGAHALFSVDVNTGAREPMLTLPDATESPGTVLAEDALAAPRFDAPEPPHPMDPRLRLGLIVLVVLLGGGRLVIWWRRERV